MQPSTHPLQRFQQAKQAEITYLRHAAEHGTLPPPLTCARPSFRQALHRRGDLPAVIAEYKRASPSQGIIQQSLNADDVARCYHAGGAAAMSVLTEEHYFQGSFSHLHRAHSAGTGLPLLRKDFLSHPLQIAHTASTPASALLLIVRLTPSARVLRDLREQAESLGMEAVVEIFSLEDLSLARTSGAGIIQVNARDLESFAVNPTACMNLARQHRHRADSPEVWIAASGITAPEHLRTAADNGYDAVLVGTALMEGGNPRESLMYLLGEMLAPPDPRTPH